MTPNGKNHKGRASPPAPLPAGNRTQWLQIAAGGAVALGALIALAAYAFRGRETASLPPVPPPQRQPQAAHTPAPTVPPLPKPAALTVDASRLVGRWLRPDGGYVLEIKSVASDGHIDAAYRNPRPIRVSKAEVTSRGEGGLKLHVELRDEGYDGNYYTLVYDAETDRLTGVYHQLTLGQRFDIEFVRMPS